MYGIIYMTTNLIDGCKYIGQHKCSDLNDNYLGSGNELKYAVKMYGRENFIRETLYICESPEEMNEKEIEFIAKYNATTNPYFYNICRGGDGNPDLGYWNKGRKASNEAKRKMSIAHKLCKHSEESKKKIGKANSRYHKLGGRRGAKPVVCVETGIVYASCYDAARAIGCGLSSISACFSGACKTVKGYHWRHATPEEISGKLVYVS